MNYQGVAAGDQFVADVFGCGLDAHVAGGDGVGRVGVRVGLGGARATTPRGSSTRSITTRTSSVASSASPKRSVQQLRGVVGQLEQRLREDPQTHCD